MEATEACASEDWAELVSSLLGLLQDVAAWPRSQALVPSHPPRPHGWEAPAHGAQSAGGGRGCKPCLVPPTGSLRSRMSSPSRASCLLHPLVKATVSP